MRLLKTQLAITASLIALSHAASAQGVFTGGMAAAPSIFEVSSATHSDASFSLNADNIITGTPSGTFALAGSLNDLTAYSGTISGLSTVPTVDVIASFFTFSSADSTFGTTGTTPANRFSFNLATIASMGAGTGAFTGTGTFTDSQGAFLPTPGSFTVGFSSPNNYSLTMSAVLTPVPEPATVSLVAAGAIAMLALRRRKA